MLQLQLLSQWLLHYESAAVQHRLLMQRQRERRMPLMQRQREQ